MKIFTDICNRVVHSCRKAERQKPQLAGRAAAISEEAVTDAAQIVGKRRWPWIGVILDNIAKSGRNPTRVVAGYLAAWILFFVVLWVIPTPEGLSPQGMAVMAIVVWASLMWISEAMPVGITGISIPLLLIVTQAIPWVKTGNTLTPPLATVFAGFTTDVIWLCLFAFMVGGMMQLMKLDRRIAMVISIRSAWKSRSFIRLERGDEGKRT